MKLVLTTLFTSLFNPLPENMLQLFDEKFSIVDPYIMVNHRTVTNTVHHLTSMYRHFFRIAKYHESDKYMPAVLFVTCFNVEKWPTPTDWYAVLTHIIHVDQLTLE